MNVPLSHAKAKLTQLVKQAQAGEDIVLTRHGRPAAHIVGIKAPIDPGARRRALEEARAMSADFLPGPDAAHSQDFLYDENGLPG